MINPTSPIAATPSFHDLTLHSAFPLPEQQEQDIDISQFKIGFNNLPQPLNHLSFLAHYPVTMARLFKDRPKFLDLQLPLFMEFTNEQAIAYCDFATILDLPLPTLDEFFKELERKDLYDIETLDVLKTCLPQLFAKANQHRYVHVNIECKKSLPIYEKIFTLQGFSWTDGLLYPRLICAKKEANRLLHYYANRSSESFQINSSHTPHFYGKRFLSNDVTEVGEFDIHTKIFLKGYCKSREKPIEIKKFTPQLQLSKTNYALCEIEEKLHVFVNGAPAKNIKLLNAVLYLCREARENELYSVLTHSNFLPLRHDFIDAIMKTDSCGIPVIFGFKPAFLPQIVDFADIDPKKIINPHAAPTLLDYMAHHPPLSKKVMESYPDIYEVYGNHLLHQCTIEDNLSLTYEGLQLPEDPFYNLWLTSQSKGLSDRQKKIFKTFTDHQKKVIYKTAALFNNLHIYEPLKEPVSSDQYSLNFMWINSTSLSESDPYFIGKNDSEFSEKFVFPILNWISFHQNTSVRIWYDSQMAPERVMQRSKETLIAHCDKDLVRTFEFADIRNLTLVKSYPSVFDSSTEVYYRADLLRFIAAYETLQHEPKRYFVYADLDVKPLSASYLFDKRTSSLLETTGIIFAHSHLKMGWENSFIIVDKAHSQCLSQIHEHIIVPSVSPGDDRKGHHLRSEFEISQKVFWRSSQLILPFREKDPTLRPVKAIDSPLSHFDTLTTFRAYKLQNGDTIAP